MAVAQHSLFGRTEEPSVDPTALARARHIALDATAWMDYLPGWVVGHVRLFERLSAALEWRSERREMYDRMVDVPRLIGTVPAGQALPPVIEEMCGALCRHHRHPFTRVSFALYRDGNDSVAWHGDTVARTLPQALVATVSLGEPRKFLVRPTGGGPSRSLMLGWGDLLVMGGSSQRTWQHAIPKTAGACGPRLVIMFRPDWE
jgi:alkylated DNA repair dioxygenase AlkB